MNMFATQGGVVELWVTKTDTYTSTKTGEIYASVQSIAPIPEGARGNAKGFEISEYNIEPTLLTPSSSKASRCSASSPAWSARPKTVSVGSPIPRCLWICWPWAASRWRRPPKPRPARKRRPKPRPAQQPQGQDKQDKSPDAKA